MKFLKWLGLAFVLYLVSLGVGALVRGHTQDTALVLSAPTCAMQAATVLQCEVTVPAQYAHATITAGARQSTIASWCRSLDARSDGAYWKANGTAHFVLVRADGSSVGEVDIPPGTCP